MSEQPTDNNNDKSKTDPANGHASPANGHKNGNDSELIREPTSLMEKSIQHAKYCAQFDEHPAIIIGETGTGKEAIADILHKDSRRKKGPFVTVNCAGLNENLIESELFGHEKGSFTGAYHKRIGAFERAEGGTLFLDEITEMPIQSQAKLLRALQDHKITRVGGNDVIKTNVRIIAATNRDLEEAVYEEKTLREDLFHRLMSGSVVELPPLRDRKEDLPILVKYFSEKAIAPYREYGFEVAEILPEALAILMNYDWPGNVRELEGVIGRAARDAQNVSPGAEVIITPELKEIKKLEEKEREIGLHTRRLCAEENGGQRTPKEIKDDLWQLLEDQNISKVSKETGLHRSNIYRFFKSDTPGIATMIRFRDFCIQINRGKAFNELFGEMSNIRPVRTK